jgi:hypothetical protein
MMRIQAQTGIDFLPFRFVIADAPTAPLDPYICLVH